MHLELLLQVSDLSLILLEEESWVLELVDDCFVLHLHHPGGELESGDGLLQVVLFRPDVCDHDSHAVTTDRALE